MLATYIKALESRAAWAQWAEEYPALLRDVRKRREAPNYDVVMRMYRDSLLLGDTLYMNKEFCALVDHARATVPDDLVFEEGWMHTRAGFMWLETPFVVPTPVGFNEDGLGIITPTLRAVSWFPHDGGYVFLTYMDWKSVFNDSKGFGCWTHFSIRDGDILHERMKSFEASADDPDAPGVGKYTEGDKTDKLHELRWVFTAMHLMAQRLATTVEHRTSPMARESARRKNLALTPLLKVVALRRMEADRPAGGEHQHRDWQWKWLVQGHWRNQWYESESIHRRIFIESYVKGPDDKPLKLPGHTIFKVER